MRWCLAILLAFAAAMLLARPVSADSLTEPLAAGGSHIMSTSKMMDPVSLGAFATDESSHLAPPQVFARSASAPDEEFAKAIINGIPAVYGTGFLTKSGSPIDIAAVDLEASPREPEDTLERATVAAPEPIRLLFLGTGLLGLAIVLFRRARLSAVVVGK